MLGEDDDYRSHGADLITKIIRNGTHWYEDTVLMERLRREAGRRVVALK